MRASHKSSWRIGNSKPRKSFQGFQDGISGSYAGENLGGSLHSRDIGHRSEKRVH